MSGLYSPWWVSLLTPNRVIRAESESLPWTLVATINSKLPEAKAVARLTSAAPELLEAAQSAQRFIANIPIRARTSEEKKVLNLLADAIAKATGNLL